MPPEVSASNLKDAGMMYLGCLHYIRLRQSRKKGRLGHLVPLQAQLTRYGTEIRYPIVRGKTAQSSTEGRWEESHRIGFHATFFDPVPSQCLPVILDTAQGARCQAVKPMVQCFPESKNHLTSDKYWSTVTPSLSCVCLAWFSPCNWYVLEYYTGSSNVPMSRRISFWLFWFMSTTMT